MAQSLLRRAANLDVCVLMRSSCAFLADSLAASANGSAVVVDLQHGAAHVGNVQPMLAAIRARGKRPLVRVPAKGEAGTVGRVLDLGAAGVICPLVNTAEEARALVQACRYPPRGQRSWGPLEPDAVVERNVQQRNSEITVLAMIETAEGLKNVKSICEVEGLDGIYVGPYDMSLSLGLNPADPGAESAQMREVVSTIATAASEAGVLAGIHTGSWAMVQRLAQCGYQFFTLGTDVSHAVDGWNNARRQIDARPAPAKDSPAAVPASAEPRPTDVDLVYAMGLVEDDALALASATAEDGTPANHPSLRRQEMREQLQKLKELRADPVAWKEECAAWAEALQEIEHFSGGAKR